MKMHSPNTTQTLKQEFLERYKQLNAIVQAQSEPIAVIGKGCRFPGGVNNPETYWQMLRQGIDTMTEIPLERWNINAYYDADPNVPGKMYTREGAFLNQIDQFDPQFFGISPREAMAMDPQQRLLLELSWEAMENAAIAPDSLMNSSTGVFMGIFRDDYSQLCFHNGALNHIDAYNSLGVSRAIAVGRLSYVFGLQGPTMQLDTACSSSLLAIHLACQSLRSQECNLALAGGVNLMLTPSTAISNCKLKAVSPDGRCKTFDAAANGYGRGEGGGVVILKRLKDALANGDRILALIRGSAVNHDGRSNGLTAPNGQAQEALLRQTLKQAKIKPEQLQYVEVHGTGTSLGDPIEVIALGKVYGQGRSPENPLILGTVKTNMGHLEGAAGIAAFLKTILQLQHQQIVPNLHFQNPNPYIPWDKLPVKVPTELIPWSVPGGSRLAGVSAFGMSGTNVHLIVEEAPELLSKEQPTIERSHHLLTLSAKTEQALLELVNRYQTFLLDHPHLSIADICYTANTGRSHFEHVLAVVTQSVGQLNQQLTAIAQGCPSSYYQDSVPTKKPPLVAFLFTGQGSQYVGMGWELYQTQPTFRSTLERCDAILSLYLGQSILDILYPFAWQADPSSDTQNSLLDQTTYTQPALFALEYALAQLWQSWNIIPTWVAGHSLGEYVAACVAGVFSLEDGLKLVAARARLMDSVPQHGAMAAILSDLESVKQVIASYQGKIAIAAINSRENVVISGESEAIKAALADFEVQNIPIRPLKVSQAFHSPLMRPVVAEFESIAQTVTFSSPQIPLVSSVTGELIDEAIATPQYWVRHLLAPVEFAKAMETLEHLNGEIFLEIGPKLTLLTMCRQTLPQTRGIWLGSLKPNQSNWETMLDSLAQLYVQGLPINWRGFDQDYQRQKISLPTYPFQRQRYWLDHLDTSIENSANSSSYPQLEHLHPLLHQQMQLLGSEEIRFQSHLHPRTPSFLQDHQVFATTIVPATVYLEMVLAAGVHHYGTCELAIEQVILHQALILPEDQAHMVQMTLNPQENSVFGFQILSLNANEPNSDHLHASGKVYPILKDSYDPQNIDLAALQSRCDRSVAIATHYQQCLARGVNYGLSFRAIKHLWRNEQEILALIELPESLVTQADQFELHPVLLDACFHAIATLFPDGEDEVQTYLPIGLERLARYRHGGTGLYCHAQLISGDPSSPLLTANLILFSETGALIARVDGLSFGRANPQTLLKAPSHEFQDWLYEPSWQIQPLQAQPRLSQPSSSPWLIFCDRSGVGEQLAIYLQQQGDHCILVWEDQIEDQQTRETLARKTDSHLLLNPNNPLDWQQILQQRTYAGILYLWSLDYPHLPTTSAALEDSQKLICGSVLRLIHTLAPAEFDPIPRLWLVTCGAQTIGSTTTAVAMQQTGLWGLGRVIALEHPEFQCIRIDGDFLDSTATLAEQLFQEVQTPDQEDQIAWREGIRYVARLKRSVLKSNAAILSVEQNGSYLITGGLGALGQCVAHWLVAQGAKSLVLLSRRGVTPDAQPVISQWKKAGVQVRVLQADVSQTTEVANALDIIKTELPPLRGIIHTAGVLADATLLQQDWGNFMRVLAPKALGAWNLHTLTQDCHLDWFVCFSSIASLVGSSGQGNYVTANAFIDALAHHRQALGLPGLSINWGPWEETGMAQRLDHRAKARLKHQGFGNISIEEGCKILQQLLLSNCPQVGVVPLNWSRFLAQSSTNSLFLSDFQVKSRQKSPKTPRFLQQLEDTPIAERRAVLLSYVKAFVAEILGIKVAEFTHLEKGFFDLGMDSLMAMELRNRLANSLQCSLPSMVTFKYPTVKNLVNYLETEVICLEFTAIHSTSTLISQKTDELNHEIEHLSENEIANLLAQELTTIREG
ncbi:MAG: type I polyketide synthase [Desmonostoc geniculatum HA4340-LM1]|jgi:acyl transferase domain-containing protein/acyl carrier protein|nr:type I polyketide synthase [Desmonostoc geniculatum HA4340-LM1]